MPACFALSQQMERGHPLDDLRLASAIFLADVAQVESDLLNDDLLDDRGLALGIADRRSVGQALAASLGGWCLSRVADLADVSLLGE